MTEYGCHVVDYKGISSHISGMLLSIKISCCTVKGRNTIDSQQTKCLVTMQMYTKHHN